MKINVFIDGPQADCLPTARPSYLNLNPNYNPTLTLTPTRDQADCSRTATIVGACELQVGVISTLNALHGNHLPPYERQRILDGIPQVSLAPADGACVANPVEIASMPADPSPPLPLLTLHSKPPSKDKYINAYHAVKTTKPMTLTHKDAARATQAAGP